MNTIKQPTIMDVARVAGVSKKTVSRVLNRSQSLHEDTRRRVEQVIESLGYVPNLQARALALRRNYLIGLVHDNPNTQTVINVQQGMLEALRDTDFEMVVRPIGRGSATVVDEMRKFLERQRPYGVLLMPPLSENEAIARLCQTMGCRYVRMGWLDADLPRHTVGSNDREAVRGATEYLIGLGHRQIGLVGGPHGFRSARERHAGFAEAMAAAGLALPRSRVVDGDYSFGSGLLAGERLLERMPRPTAILACNDEMAVGVLHAARMRGLDVPGDLSIIGFDDSSVASHLWPPLTTVHWPIASMAHAGAMKLIAAEGEDDDEPSLFVSRLVKRESVAPPR